MILAGDGVVVLIISSQYPYCMVSVVKQCCCTYSCMEVFCRKTWSYRKDGKISRVNSTAIISYQHLWIIMKH